MIEVSTYISSGVNSTSKDLPLEIAQDVARAITTEYPKARVLVVGSNARDSLRDTPSNDIELEVHGLENNQLSELLETNYPNIIECGKSFPIFKINIAPGKNIDIALPGTEQSTGPKHTDFDTTVNPHMDLEVAAARRDFTINAIMQDALTGEVIDPFGGVSDLESKTLRITDPERFSEDPLRVLRSAQFVARLGFEIESESFEIMQKMVHHGALDHLTPARITHEIEKLLLKSESPSIGLEILKDLGVTERYFPELHALSGIEQDATWHPEGDVWIHTMMVVDEAAKLVRRTEEKFSETEKLQVIMGALCHDFGKVPTTEFKDGRWRAHGHEAAGEEPTREFLKRFEFSKELEESVVCSVVNHLRPASLHSELERNKIDDNQYRKAVAKLIRKTHPINWKVLLAVAEADLAGRTTEDRYTRSSSTARAFKEAVALGGLDVKPPEKLVTGKELIDLGFKPGPKMGDIQRTIERFRDMGQLSSKADALSWIKFNRESLES